MHHIPMSCQNSEHPVEPLDVKRLQKVNGKFLWYARGVDGTMLTALSALAAQQSKATTKTMKNLKQFLNYAATQEPPVLTYHKSDMTLAVHSNASYLNEANTKKRAGGHHYLSENTQFPPNNSAILNITKIIKQVIIHRQIQIGIPLHQCTHSSQGKTNIRRNGAVQPPHPHSNR